MIIRFGESRFNINNKIALSQSIFNYIIINILVLIARIKLIINYIMMNLGM